MNKEIKGERKVIIKRNHKTKCNVTQNTFFSLNTLGNCTICKISLALLIIVSFIVVKPQSQGKYNNSIQTDTLIVSKKDTIHIVNTNKYKPTGLILGSNQ